MRIKVWYDKKIWECLAIHTTGRFKILKKCHPDIRITIFREEKVVNSMDTKFDKDYKTVNINELELYEGKEDSDNTNA